MSDFVSEVFPCPKLTYWSNQTECRVYANKKQVGTLQKGKNSLTPDADLRKYLRIPDRVFADLKRAKIVLQYALEQEHIFQVELHLQEEVAKQAANGKTMYYSRTGKPRKERYPSRWDRDKEEIFW